MSNKRPWYPAHPSPTNSHEQEQRNAYIEQLSHQAELNQLKLEQLRQKFHPDQATAQPLRPTTECASSRLHELRQLQLKQRSEYHFLAMCRSNLSRHYIAFSEESDDLKLKHLRKYQAKVSPRGNIPLLMAFDEETRMQRKKCQLSRASNIQPPRLPKTPMRQTLPEYLSVPQPSWHAEGQKDGSSLTRKVSNSDDATALPTRGPNKTELFSRKKQQLITPQCEHETSESSSDEESTSSGSSETESDCPPPPPKLDQIITIPQPPLLRVQRDGSYRIFKANEDGRLTSPTIVPRRQLHQQTCSGTKEENCTTDSSSDGNTPRTENLSPSFIPMPRPTSLAGNSPPGLAFIVEDDNDDLIPPPKRQCGKANSIVSLKMKMC